MRTLVTGAFMLTTLLMATHAKAAYTPQPAAPLSTTLVPCTSVTGLTSSTTATVGSLTLQPGTWILTGVFGIDANAATTVGNVSGGIGTTSTSLGTSWSPSSYSSYWGATATASTFGPVMLTVRISTPTTYYLNENIYFSGGTAGGCGQLTAVQASW